MGHFLSAHQRMLYKGNFCLHCIHDRRKCFVMLLHVMWDEENREKRTIKTLALDHFIPYSETGNSKCKMFIESVNP